MPSIVQNNATGVLASNLAIGGTSLTLQTGQGARFPVASSGFFGAGFFWATLVDASNNIEIVKCTTHVSNSDTFTIQRAQQSTTAKAYVAGDRFEMRITKEHFTEKLSITGGSMSGPIYSSSMPTGYPAPGDTTLINADYFTKHVDLKIDTTYPIEMSPFAMAFRATNGKWYILHTAAQGTDVNNPWYGAGATGGPVTTTNLIEIPSYLEGKGPFDFDEVILATDAAEVFAMAYDSTGYAIGTGLAGAGHFGLGNATDLVKWTLFWDWDNAAKSYYFHWPSKIVTNGRYLHNADTNTTVWVKTDQGTIFAAGEGATGALGNNATTDSTVFYNSMQTGLTAISGVDNIWCAPNTTSPVAICRKTDGTWWAVGAGASGVCGGGVVTNRLVWTQIPELPTTSVTKVVVTGTGVIVDALILFSDGTLWGAGDNNSGSLGDGTVVLKNTYAQRASNVSNFWISSTHNSTGNHATWYVDNSGVLYTTGDAATYATLFGTTTDRTTFGAATDIPASSSLQNVWPGGAEGQSFFFQRWSTPSGYKIYAVGFATDGNRGNGAFAAATLNTDITPLLPVPADQVAWMGCMHILAASRRGYSVLVTTGGELYACGRALGSSDGGTTWDTAHPFPHRNSPTSSPTFTKVLMLEEASG